MNLRVKAPSRLHFGLLGLRAAEDSAWARSFGGAGLMIEQPGLSLHAEPAAEWSATGPLAARALAFAKDFAAATPEASGRCWKITVQTAPPEHVGLGTGTQLGLAVAKAIATSCQVGLDVPELAKRVGRGERSALGIHGFAHGGFLVDGGKGPQTQIAPQIAPLIARAPFPDEWRIVLVITQGVSGLHGAAEGRAFADDSSITSSDSLCRLVLLGILPALVEGDLPSFGAALYEFNRKVGEMFQPWQGGIYAHPRIQAIVDTIRRRGVAAVGQSSWGPTVFAIAEADAARSLASDLQQRQSSECVLVTPASNRGGDLWPANSPESPQRANGGAA